MSHAGKSTFDETTLVQNHPSHVISCAAESHKFRLAIVEERELTTQTRENVYRHDQPRLTVFLTLSLVRCFTQVSSRYRLFVNLPLHAHVGIVSCLLGI